MIIINLHTYLFQIIKLIKKGYLKLSQWIIRLLLKFNNPTQICQNKIKWLKTMEMSSEMFQNELRASDSNVEK